MNSSSEIPQLNKEQQEAVLYNQGPLLIVAGAGTGKTFVVAEKVKYLIEHAKIKPENILALTFTEKAANAMEERIDKTVPYGYFQMWVSTFHSFADQILREESAAIGLNPSYRLLGQAETIIFLRNNLFLMDLNYFRPLGNPNKFLEALLTHFSRLKDEDISPTEYLLWAKKQKNNTQMLPEEYEKLIELAKAYDMYQKLKVKEGYFDFSDLLYYLLQLFRERHSLLKKYQDQFKHVLVDEFQDTNIAQYQLIKLLCPPSKVINKEKGPHLTVVGDDSQAIYKFRGASVSNILNFMDDYKGARQITLRRNYRSGQEILDVSYRLIRHNDPDTLEAQLGISKNLLAERKEKASVEFFQAARVEEEADFVSKEIIKLKKSYRFSDFAILVRANNHADPFIRILAQKGIPYQFLGPGQLFKQPEVKDLIAYLTFLSDPEDSVSFYRILSMDVFDIDPKDISYLLSFAKKTSRPLFQALEIYLGISHADLNREDFAIYKQYVPMLKKDSKDKLLMIFKMIDRHIKYIKKDTAGQILYYFLEDSKILEKLVSYKTSKEEKIALNISKFFDKLKTYEVEHEDASVPAVVDYIKMSMELGESPIVGKSDIAVFDAVNILTVHGAKGLEFPVVFIINLTQGRFPSYQRREAIPIPNELIKEILPQGDYHILEERRLFYVALTRARDHVYLTSSQLYTEGKRERKLSNFVIEALGEDVIKKTLLIQTEEKAQLSIFDFKKGEEHIEKNIANPATTFSFSQLETYHLCPLRYKYQYILKIPTQANAAASLGTSIHTALQKFYQEFITDKKVALNRLLEFYHQSWIPIGYSSDAHQMRMKKEGEKMLKLYFNTFHKQNLQTEAMEKLFRIKISPDIFLSGKIDRVDRTPEGGLEIIDYKTGKKPDEKELQKSLQLSIYLLAVTDKSLYNEPIHKISLTFYYLQNGEKVTIKKTPEEVAEVKETIKTTIKELRQSNYTPHVGPWCDFCPFRMICEAWQ